MGALPVHRTPVTWTVPSLLMRQGDFSELLNPSQVFTTARSVTIKDPTTGIPFPDNIIPKSQLSPNGLGILKAYPVPNLAAPINGNQIWYAAASSTRRTSARTRWRWI